MAKISEETLRWRRKQAHGAIMSPAEFHRIERGAEASGATNPSAVAGSVYWQRVRERRKGPKEKR